jgi:hypothetical protein
VNLAAPAARVRDPAVADIPASREAELVLVEFARPVALSDGSVVSESGSLKLTRTCPLASVVTVVAPRK